MARVRVLIALVAALALTVGLAASAEAAPRKWPQGRITYVDRTLDPDAVKAAVRAWNTSHTNGVAPTLCLGNTVDEAKPGRWRCRLLEKVDLRRAKRIYGGRPEVRDPAWCDAVARIPATGAVTAVAEPGGWTTATVTRAPEPAVPDWLGTWAYGEPGFEVHATPNACTAVPGDDSTLVGVALWGDVPIGGTATEALQLLPTGPVCLSVWQFDRGYNFAQAPSGVLVTGTELRHTARVPDLPTRSPTRVGVTPFD